MSMNWVNRLRLQSLFITTPIFKWYFFHLKRRAWWEFLKPWLALWRRENYQCVDRAKIFPMKRQDRRANGLVGRTSNCQRERLWIRDDWTETQSANKLVGWFPTGVSDPGIPLSPCDPDSPFDPVSPFDPFGPVGPLAPVSPLGPWTAPWIAFWNPWAPFWIPFATPETALWSPFAKAFVNPWIGFVITLNKFCRTVCRVSLAIP